MTKNNQVEKSRSGNLKLNSSGSQVQNSQAINTQSKAILKIKQAKPRKFQIKDSLKDNEGV